MIEGIMSGLFFFWWILTLFGFDNICLKVVQSLIHSVIFTKEHYYFAFAVMGMIGECINR